MLIRDLDGCYHQAPPFEKSSLIRFPMEKEYQGKMMIVCMYCKKEIPKEEDAKQ